jgi:hypothetical protein
MSTNSEELEIISCCDDFIEDLHADDEMIEDQNDINFENDLKQPTASFLHIMVLWNHALVWNLMR